MTGTAPGHDTQLSGRLFASPDDNPGGVGMVNFRMGCDEPVQHLIDLSHRRIQDLFHRQASIAASMGCGIGLQLEIGRHLCSRLARGGENQSNISRADDELIAGIAQMAVVAATA